MSDSGLRIAGGGDMLKATYDPDVDGIIALAQLVAAVCSETEADGKITTHAGVAAAHHAKTALASEITSGQFPVDRMPRAASGFLEGKGAGVNPAYSAIVEADIPAHMAKGKLAFTLNKLLKGAGAGADPTEIDVPSAKVTVGTYTGNSTVNRAIAHGLGVTPAIIFINDTTNTLIFIIIPPWSQHIHIQVANVVDFATGALTATDATNFYVGLAADYMKSANLSGSTYNWVAIGA